MCVSVLQSLLLQQKQFGFRDLIHTESFCFPLFLLFVLRYTKLSIPSYLGDGQKSGNDLLIYCHKANNVQLADIQNELNKSFNVLMLHDSMQTSHNISLSSALAEFTVKLYHCYNFHGQKNWILRHIDD